MPIKVFFCYAHEDEALLNKLKSHLSPLKRQGLIATWHDRDISAGTEWEKAVKEQINAAQIILLLVSSDFINSDYCYSTEMHQAIERHKRGEARVIPVILRHVHWRGEPLGKLQALPTDGKPVKSQHWYDLDEAFLGIVEGIRKVLEEMTTQPLGSSSATSEQAARLGTPTSQHHQRGSIVLEGFDYYSQKVGAEALAQLREEMQRRSEADRLLLEADRFASDLFERESLIKQAVELCPDYKAKRYRQLGLEMSAAVVNGYDPIQQMGIIRAGLGRGMVGYRKLERDEIASLKISAISYLREYVLDAETPDAEGLLYLACMYGYQQQFEDMLTIIGKAIEIDEEIKEGFRQRKILLALLRACGSDQKKLERLRKRLRIALVAKKSFCKFIQEFDLTDFNRYIEWLAMKRPNTAGERGIFIIQITPPYVQNNGLVYASALNVEPMQYESVSNGEPLSINELYDVLDASFILICTSV